MELCRSETSETIALLPERLAAMQELGRVLLEYFDGSFEQMVRQADHSALKLVQIVISHFCSFRDEAVYHGVPGLWVDLVLATSA